MHKILILLFACYGFAAMADATSAERATTDTNSVERTAKKATHRVQEAVCSKGDVKCAEQKAKNRAEEAKDYVKDKGQETKQKIDDSKSSN